MKEAPKKTSGKKGNKVGSVTASRKGNNPAPLGTDTLKNRESHVHYPQATRLNSGAKKQGGN